MVRVCGLPCPAWCVFASSIYNWRTLVSILSLSYRWFYFILFFLFFLFFSFLLGMPCRERSSTPRRPSRCSHPCSMSRSDQCTAMQIFSLWSLSMDLRSLSRCAASTWYMLCDMCHVTYCDLMQCDVMLRNNDVSRFCTVKYHIEIGHEMLPLDKQNIWKQIIRKLRNEKELNWTIPSWCFWLTPNFTTYVTFLFRCGCAWSQAAHWTNSLKLGRLVSDEAFRDSRSLVCCSQGYRRSTARFCLYCVISLFYFFLSTVQSKHVSLFALN